MAKKSCSDEEFIRLFKEHGPTVCAKELGITESGLYRRRRRLESRMDLPLPTPSRTHWEALYPSRVPIELKDGVMIVGSDCHYWPGIVSTAHRAYVKLCKELNPKIVVLNGDVFDGASLSRFPPIGWERKPTVKEEKEAVEERLTDIEDATKRCKRIWTLGNHCYRFENKLAANAPQFEGIKGFTLKDHFPQWDMMISAWVNDLVVKHRYKGGIHATHNNTLNSGKSILTGHLHSLKVTPFSDYNGDRYGIDSGTMMKVDGPQSAYTEDNPLNHRSGLIVVTFYKGRLLCPEIVSVLDENHVSFRGVVIRV